ncbi:hypothetical protein [Arthrobacter psychrolactophilus]
MKTRALLALSAASLALLTACSGAAKDAATSTQPSELANTVPAVSDSPSAQASDASQNLSSWTAPDTCTAQELSFGATLDGGPLGECVSQALASYGSGKMSMSNGDDYGTVAFTYTPDYSVQGTMTSAGEEIELTFLDGTMWIDSGEGPIKGDPESENPEEVLVAAVAEMYKVFSNPAMTAELISASPKWGIDGALALRTLDNGENVQAYRMESTEPFSWNGIPVSEMILWFGEDWMPVGTQASLSMAGVSTTTTQQFYDLGKPVEIKAPS